MQICPAASDTLHYVEGDTGPPARDVARDNFKTQTLRCTESAFIGAAFRASLLLLLGLEANLLRLRLPEENYARIEVE
jgi:hypothetical protein